MYTLKILLISEVVLALILALLLQINMATFINKIFLKKTWLPSLKLSSGRKYLFRQ